MILNIQDLPGVPINDANQQLINIETMGQHMNLVPKYPTQILSQVAVTHITALRPSWIMSGTTRVSRHQKGKPIWIYWSKRQ